MKKSFFLMVVLGICHLCSAEEHATKGAITEALFIIQNKQCEIREYVEELKKALTECSIVPTGSVKNRRLRLGSYHCYLKQMVYPCSIQELETHIGRLAQDVDTFAQDKPVAVDALKSAVARAFLLKDKIESEERMMALVFTLDIQQNCINANERFFRRGKRSFSVDAIEQGPRRRLSAGEIRMLKRNMSQDRTKLQEVRQGLAKINNELYQKSKDAAERLYLENLECFMF